MSTLYRLNNKKIYGWKDGGKDTDRAWLEINLQNLGHNVRQLKKIMSDDCRLMAVVKADAYGHGAVRVAEYLNGMGIGDFAVATLDEGIELRKNHIKGRILIFGHTDIARIRLVKKYDLIQTVTDPEYAKAVDDCGSDIKTEIKLDTGMHRFGFDTDDIDGIVKVFGYKGIRVCGIYSHLCVSDSTAKENVEFTERQIIKYYRTLERLKQRGIKLPATHIQSSYGLLNYPQVRCDYARIGIAMYGVLSSYGDKAVAHPDLKPVMSVKARVSQIKHVKSGETIGYGRTFMTKRDSRIAVVSIGYADGIPRELSGEKDCVIIHGKKAPVIGRICMDVMEVDVTDIENVNPGDTVTVIGRDGDEVISAESVAESADTITNELLSRMGTRLKRKYI